MSPTPTAVVVGAGPGLGAALCRRFAREGLAVVAVRRRHADELDRLSEQINSAGGRAIGLVLDARREENVVELFDRTEREVGPVEIAVFNPGANILIPVAEMPARKFFKVWEMACFAGFLVGREAARRMLPRGRGTIVFTGATASTRAIAGFAAFASAKHGLRALALSLARELSPRGIHVAHVVLDGALDTPFMRATFGAVYEERGPDAMLDPDTVACNYWTLHAQPRSAWTFELDLRSWLEPW